MKKRKHEESTSKYYDENAEEFLAGTENADMSEARNKFLSYMPEKGLILDWGCGSGRDALAFKEAGYDVEATDASEEMCKFAAKKLGQEVRQESFDMLNAKEKYDGIWACASLLHLEKDRLPETLGIAKKALKKGGVMYVSFKNGDFEGEVKGRYFTNLTEDSFEAMIKRIKHLEVRDQWITEDVRGDREQKWLNAVMVKE